jgi:DNA helicase-2/ATP-dependent DNA helicase PcrA
VDRLNKRELSDGDRHAIRRALQRYDDPARTGADTGIAVLTIHASKGRDADHVVLYDGITSRISREMNKSDATQANEHRTWYVACTRAKKTLHIMRDGFDWTTSVIPQDIGRAIGLDGDTRADTGGGETA